jgi:uncharacterized membrane protein
MRKLLAGVAVPMLALLIGCNQQSTPGGPGVSTTPSNSGTSSTNVKTNKPIYGEAEGTFELSVPSLSTRIKQGESNEITMSISRGKNFNEDVTLKFEGLPSGVTAEPTTAMIAKSDKDVKVTFHAAPDAAVGEYTVKVLGHPTTGADATNNIKLTVVEKS